MANLNTQYKEGGDVLIPPPPLSLLSPIPSYSVSSSTQSDGKISPAIILIIVILAIVFFVSGVLHLLVRFLMKRPTFYSSVSRSNRYPEEDSGSDALQRQLQQLFRLHDSGLDQALIDALPVFQYKDIMGLKEPFDCAVCLSEFSDQDELRLLPMCSHAFHISCIDTWLLSNSTCPLCRGSLLRSGLETREFSLDYWRQLSLGCSINVENNSHSLNHNKPTIMEENARERRVFSIRLGKFRSLNDGEETKERENGDTSTSISSSSSKLDARRCYSLGSYQYVLADSNLQVALSTEIGGANNCGIKIEKMVGQSMNSLVDGDVVEGKKIGGSNKRDSFSVSKIWLWSKKGKFVGSPKPNVHGDPPCPLNVVLPLSARDQLP